MPRDFLLFAESPRTKHSEKKRNRACQLAGREIPLNPREMSSNGAVAGAAAIAITQ